MTCALFHASVIPMTFTNAGRTARFFALLCSAAIVWSLITPATSAAAPDGVKPTIVLVHGAWADASSWNGEVDELQAQGYVVRAIANHSKTSPPILATSPTSSDRSTDRSCWSAIPTAVQ